MMVYIAAIFSLIMGMGAIFTLVEKFPVKLLYYHSRYRKPIVWTIFLSTLSWQILIAENGFYFQAIPPLLIMVLAIVLAYKAHQSNWFQAVYFPKMTTDYDELPLTDDSEMALIEYEGLRKAYPLEYVIHHHIVNDKFNQKTIALTYCAMCRSIIPFDVSEIGPLFVASFKNANMIVADKKTGTFFQQATFDSIIGKLHPHSLTMIPFQILPWKNVKNINPPPLVARVKKSDLRPFKLPIPGVWKKVMSSELTPGLSTKDTTLPSKTRVIGLYDFNIFYLKADLPANDIITNKEFNFCLLKKGNTVVGFKNAITTNSLKLKLKEQDIIEDLNSGTTWDLTGKYIKGSINSALSKVFLSDEYFFSWKRFHPESKLASL